MAASAAFIALLGVQAEQAVLTELAVVSDIDDAVPTPPAKGLLPKNTPVYVMLEQDLSTKTSQVGDGFDVTVLHDVMDGDTVVIPQGTRGFGEVMFVTDRGGFGKAGLISLSLRYLELDGKQVALDGRYREEGKSRKGATEATWIAVGVFSGFIKGGSGEIGKGRELKARTGEDIPYIIGAEPPAPPSEIAGITPVPDNAPTSFWQWPELASQSGEY